jgi:hypothetical protein
VGWKMQEREAFHLAYAQFKWIEKLLSYCGLTAGKQIYSASTDAVGHHSSVIEGANFYIASRRLLEETIKL